MNTMRSYSFHAPKPGYKQALLINAEGNVQTHLVEWIPPNIKKGATVKVGDDPRLFIVDSISNDTLTNTIKQNATVLMSECN